ncbi:hypothetical protein QCD71_24630, partial [Sphingomonas sp. PsM26]|nr:hypothetical protein [Sphingomonas sp. PsM26]
CSKTIVLTKSAYLIDMKKGIRTILFFLSAAQHLREQNLLVARIGLYSFLQILHFLIECLIYAFPLHF